MASNKDSLRKAYEFKIGKDRTSKLTDQQINLLSKYYNSLSQNEQQNIDSALFQGRTCELTEMADAFISETKGTVGGGVSVYKPEDKWVDDKKEFAKEQERKLDDALSETSDAIMDAVNAFIEADKKRFEDFKKQQQKDATIKRRTADILKKLENSTKKREQYATAIGPMPMYGPKEPPKREAGLIGTRKVLTLRQVEEKYGLSPQAPFPEWTKKVVKNASVDDDDWEDETNDLLSGKLDDILKQVREEPLPEQPKKKSRSKKTPLKATKRYDFDPEQVDNKKKLSLILENVVESRKLLFQLYKINKERFEFKKTVDKRLTNELEAKQREKEIEKGTKKEEETLFVKLGKKAKSTLIESLLAGFTAGAIGLVTEWDNFVKGIETAFPYLFENDKEEKEKQERREREQSGENTSLSDQSGGLGSPDVNIDEGKSDSTNPEVSINLPTNSVVPTNPEVATNTASDNRNIIDKILFPAAAARELPERQQPMSERMNAMYTRNFLALAGVAAIEGGDDQARADVAQSVYNRYRDLQNFEGRRDYLGPSGKANYKANAGTANDLGILYMLLKEGQYQPVFTDPNNNAAASPQWMKVLNDPDPYGAVVDAMRNSYRLKGDPRANDINAIKNTLNSTIQALTNRAKQASARSGVGGRTDFRGSWNDLTPFYDAMTPASEVFFRGSFGDNVNNQFFGDTGTNVRNEGIQMGAAPIPSNLLFKNPSAVGSTSSSSPNNPSARSSKKTVPVPPPPPKQNFLQWMLQKFTGGQQQQQQSSTRIDTSNMNNIRTIGEEPPQQPLN